MSAPFRDFVDRIPGVGKATEARLKELGIATVRDLRDLGLEALETRFGRYGRRLHELANGIDHSPVVPDRPRKSLSAEDTFERDLPLSETEGLIRRLTTNHKQEEFAAGYMPLEQAEELESGPGRACHRVGMTVD
jgi:nucleotidyltransferase/DNA polymerase involved in DNA repair